MYVTPQVSSSLASPDPTPPAAPPIPSTLLPNDRTQSMNVKRINWEKIDAPDSNTVWGKVTNENHIT